MSPSYDKCGGYSLGYRPTFVILRDYNNGIITINKLCGHYPRVGGFVGIWVGYIKTITDFMIITVYPWGTKPNCASIGAQQ